MAQPAISVIVPIYKAEKYIHRCIDSILAQTFTDFELLLIDDGSPDRCGVICDEYAAKDSRVRVFHKENGGVSSARNLGLRNAKGEWIAFIDSDDCVEHNFLDIFNTSVAHFDMIHCGLQLEEKPGNFVRRFVFETKKIKPIDIFTPQYYSSYSYTYFYKKSIIESCKLYFNISIKYSEDRDFIIRYLSQCTNDVLLIDNQAYHYCLNPTSAVHSTRSYERCMDDLKVLRSLQDTHYGHLQFIFKLCVKNFIYAVSIYCKDKPKSKVIVSDLKYYTENTSCHYNLYNRFIKHPSITMFLIKLYWKLRAAYIQIK